MPSIYIYLFVAQLHRQSRTGYVTHVEHIPVNIGFRSRPSPVPGMRYMASFHDSHLYKYSLVYNGCGCNSTANVMEMGSMVSIKQNVSPILIVPSVGLSSVECPFRLQNYKIV